MTTAPAPFREVRLGGQHATHFEDRADGALAARSTEPLRPYTERLTDAFEATAASAPERTVIAQRDAAGQWMRISYGDALRFAESIGTALLARGLSADRPLMVLSGNSNDHFLLMLGALWAGVPIAPVSPAYSLVSTDFQKLRYLVMHMTPGMVFVDDATVYAHALLAVVPADVEIVSRHGTLNRPVTPIIELLDTPCTEAARAVHAAVGGDSIAKFLFTSGSTNLPKAVPNTHRMLSANQQMLRQMFPFLADEPPVLVDWLPWNHTFGGNHNTGIAYTNGGTLYIDEGKPTPAGLTATLQNLRDIAPTMYFNVPKGWEDIGLAMESDERLRECFFSRVKVLFYSGAGLSQPAWDRLDRLAVQTIGKRVRMLTSLGMTETAPACTMTFSPEIRAGEVGVPAPGCETKLVPLGDKQEVRFRGPHVMSGYWRAPELNRHVFDEEGYLCTGDALCLIDPARRHLGFRFNGRIAEDFKLSSGTFVSVGPLRARVIAMGAPYVLDVVVAGVNRDAIGLLVFPRLDACRAVIGADAGMAASDVLAAPAVVAVFQDLLERCQTGVTGSASRVACMLLLTTPPSLDRGEVTDKGSINQRAVLSHRAADVERLYSANDAAVLTLRPALNETTGNR